MIDIPVAAVYAKSVNPSDSPRYFRIRPSETLTYRLSPAGSKATLRTRVSGEVNHLCGQENVTRTGDFRQCEDAITALATRDENCDDRYDHCCEIQW
ncbi:hypothetical protein BRARA_D00309 [Brassica rapa]|uniref:Uncharacterized protein n=1 Tax=Brassica campestris TaxID=3711 RepID=A0A397ZHG4_BRACM|nr:hypothetical protein BRARA_D00309 [Brassica rapa]